jgi:hypothetical protein
MPVSPQLLVGVLVALAGAIATLGILTYQNRAKIHRVMDWAFGHHRDETDGGAAEKHESLSTQMVRIEKKIDAEAKARQRDHDEVEQQIRRNRLFFDNAFENLADVLNDELDAVDLNVDDVEPSWVDRDERYFGDGGPPDGPGDD